MFSLYLADIPNMAEVLPRLLSDFFLEPIEALLLLSDGAGKTITQKSQVREFTGSDEVLELVDSISFVIEAFFFFTIVEWDGALGTANFVLAVPG